MVLIFCGLLLSAQSQQKIITGTVTSAPEGTEALPGVSVFVKGSTVGINTDINGKYTLAIPQNATTLVFSYIGMKKQEVEIGDQSVIDVILEPDILGLDEVVVTAIGISRQRKSLGYAVQDVS